jgi:hypothetical protein
MNIRRWTTRLLFSTAPSITCKNDYSAIGPLEPVLVVAINTLADIPIFLFPRNVPVVVCSSVLEDIERDSMI